MTSRLVREEPDAEQLPPAHQHSRERDAQLQPPHTEPPSAPHARATSCLGSTGPPFPGCRMLSIAKARKDYYLQKLGEISPGEDYYLRGGTATGRWYGRGAVEQGLEGIVSGESLVRLFHGENPPAGGPF